MRLSDHNESVQTRTEKRNMVGDRIDDVGEQLVDPPMCRKPSSMS